jgi:hypothetical protein
MKKSSTRKIKSSKAKSKSRFSVPIIFMTLILLATAMFFGKDKLSNLPFLSAQKPSINFLINLGNGAVIDTQKTGDGGVKEKGKVTADDVKTEVKSQVNRDKEDLKKAKESGDEVAIKKAEKDLKNSTSVEKTILAPNYNGLHTSNSVASGTPGASCPGANSNIGHGQYAQSGRNATEVKGPDGKLGTATQRECVKCQNGVWGGSFICGEGEASSYITRPDEVLDCKGSLDPKCSKVRGSCWSGGTWYADSPAQVGAKYCNNGAWVDDYQKERDKECAGLGEDMYYDTSKKSCQTKLNDEQQALQDVTALAQELADKKQACEAANKKWVGMSCMSESELGRIVHTCEEKQGMLFNLTTGVCGKSTAAIVAANAVINPFLGCGKQTDAMGNISWVDCTSDKKVTMIRYCSGGSFDQYGKCNLSTAPDIGNESAEIAAQDGGQAVKNPSDCKNGKGADLTGSGLYYLCKNTDGTKFVDPATLSINSPDTSEPSTVAVPSEFTNIGKECDSTAAKMENGKYADTPSCSQICQGAGSHVVSGKVVCDTPTEQEINSTRTNIPGGQSCGGTNKDTSCASGDCRSIINPTSNERGWYCMAAEPATIKTVTPVKIGTKCVLKQSDDPTLPLCKDACDKNSNGQFANDSTSSWTNPIKQCGAPPELKKNGSLCGGDNNERNNNKCESGFCAKDAGFLGFDTCETNPFTSLSTASPSEEAGSTPSTNAIEETAEEVAISEEESDVETPEFHLPTEEDPVVVESGVDIDYINQKSYASVLNSDGSNWLDTGCGVMAGAMVFSTVTGTSNPYDYNTLLQKHGQVTSGGTGWFLHKTVLEENGFDVVPVYGSVAEKEKQILEYAAEGIPVWINAYIDNGTGTYIGHHTLAVGVDAQGNLILDDPYYGENYHMPISRIDIDCSKTGKPNKDGKNVCNNGTTSWFVNAIVPPEEN